VRRGPQLADQPQDVCLGVAGQDRVRVGGRSDVKLSEAASAWSSIIANLVW